MSSPRTSRTWDMNPSGSSHQRPYHRRSSSSIRRPRADSWSSVHYDPDLYAEEIIPQDVIFDGPSASSVPTSFSAFAHRGSRTNLADEERVTKFFASEFDSDADDVLTEIDAEEEERHSVLSSRASETSSVIAPSISDLERSSEFPLIRRKSSERRSEGSISDKVRATQKLYLADEDMVIVLSGFRTRPLRLLIYRLLCFFTLGTFYLLMRWFPRWRLRFLAEAMPLSEAHWVVIEVCNTESSLT